MDRKNFIKSVGLAGFGLTLPFSKLTASPSGDTTTDSCTLIPSETEGPFPLDLTANTTFFRQDVREDRDGVQFNLKMKILGLDNCEPMSNVRVNIWHCDKDGIYSGYNNNMNPSDTNATYLRGYQMTDSNGEVEFITIFPGWYEGRICHIHFQVYVSTSYSVVSQMSFDIDTKNQIYSDYSTIYTKGSDPMTFSNDNIFSDGYSYQICSISENTTTGSYDGYIEVSVQGEGTVGVGHIEKQNTKQFSLGQNFPNPFVDQTVIPITLKQDSEVKIMLFDLQGRMVNNINLGSLSSGTQDVVINPSNMGLSAQSYIYQVEVTNSNGTYKEYKMMTSSK